MSPCCTTAGGASYIHNAKPGGPAAWAIAYVVRGVLRWPCCRSVCCLALHCCAVLAFSSCLDLSHQSLPQCCACSVTASYA